MLNGAIALLPLVFVKIGPKAVGGVLTVRCLRCSRLFARKITYWKLVWTSKRGCGCACPIVVPALFFFVRVLTLACFACTRHEIWRPIAADELDFEE